MHLAVQVLRNAGLIENDDAKRIYIWNISKAGQEYVTDQTPLWWQICQEKLDLGHAQVLHIINQLSQKTAQDHAWLEAANHASVVSELNGTEFAHRLWTIEHELKRWGFVSGDFLMDGTAMLYPTYKGLVWETRREPTLESKLIDDCVKEWETTSVEFKRELYTETAGQVAEFIKDILSLATTKASGQRWMIIGFDDDTHDYDGPPNPQLTQNHLEQLLQEYTTPMVRVRYHTVDYPKGQVGKLEVFRDPKDLPYRVARSLGAKNDKRRIVEGEIYVRHGSQVQMPTPEERQALLEEGEQARSQAN